MPAKKGASKHYDARECCFMVHAGSCKHRWSDGTKNRAKLIDKTGRLDQKSIAFIANTGFTALDLAGLHDGKHDTFICATCWNKSEKAEAMWDTIVKPFRVHLGKTRRTQAELELEKKVQERQAVSSPTLSKPVVGQVSYLYSI